MHLRRDGSLGALLAVMLNYEMRARSALTLFGQSSWNKAQVPKSPPLQKTYTCGGMRMEKNVVRKPVPGPGLMLGVPEST